MNHSYLLSSQPRLQRCFASLISAGCAIALTSCTGGSTGMPNQTVAYDGLAEIDLQPIQVCDDQGSNCAQVNLFEDITARILEQAQLKVNFLPTNRLNASRFLSLNSSSNRSSDSYEFYELSRSGSPGDYGRHEDSTRTSGPINIWFVDDIESSGSATQFGVAWVDANGVAISSATLEHNDGEGRADTVAHEIGHNLGLRHTTFGAGGKENLLTDGNNRLTPSSIDDIGVDGAGVSLLTDRQIKEIRNSGFVTGSEGDVSVDVAMADIAFLADTAGTLSGTLSGGQLASIPRSSFRLSQVNSAQAPVGRVPEPGTWLGISVLGLSMLVKRRKNQ